MTNKNNHSPPSKKKLKIAKLEQKLANRLKQKNTDKREKDVSRLETRIKKITQSKSLGVKGKLRQEIKSFESKINNPLLSGSFLDY
jgi:hypothetical protein